jgi:hypothetical protein
MAAARDCALDMAILGGQAGYHAIGGPWWAEFALAVFALLIMCLRIVFPQDSRDKLAWWRDRGRTGQHDRRRRIRRRVYKRVGGNGTSEHGQTPARTACRGSASEFSSRARDRS